MSTKQKQRAGKDRVCSVNYWTLAKLFAGTVPTTSKRQSVEHIAPPSGSRQLGV